MALCRPPELASVRQTPSFTLFTESGSRFETTRRRPPDPPSLARAPGPDMLPVWPGPRAGGAGSGQNPRDRLAAVTDDPIRIRAASTRADLETCVQLQRAVWGLSDLEINSALQLTATLHAGGLLHLAETAAGETVAFAYAFPAIRGGVAQLHSDMLAVLPGLPGARHRRAAQMGAARRCPGQPASPS